MQKPLTCREIFEKIAIFYFSLSLANFFGNGGSTPQLALIIKSKAIRHFGIHAKTADTPWQAFFLTSLCLNQL